MDLEGGEAINPHPSVALEISELCGTHQAMRANVCEPGAACCPRIRSDDGLTIKPLIIQVFLISPKRGADENSAGRHQNI